MGRTLGLLWVEQGQQLRIRRLLARVARLLQALPTPQRGRLLEILPGSLLVCRHPPDNPAHTPGGAAVVFGSFR